MLASDLATISPASLGVHEQRWQAFKCLLGITVGHLPTSFLVHLGAC